MTPHHLRVQDAETREAVFGMPAEGGQLPSIFAAAVPADSGDDSDCQLVDTAPAQAPAAFVLG